jgi:choline dehydrogenase
MKTSFVPEESASNAFDYVIVGAGSAGCVLASELSKDANCSVLLLEAGPADKSPLIRMPRGIGKLLTPPNPNIWHYSVSQGKGRPNEDWVKGRTLGGSSSVNGMVYMRGLPSEYDDWQAMGCEGWGWADIGRCYKAMEDHELGAAQWRGAGGPLSISMQPKDHPMYEVILQAAEQAGLARVADVNSAFDGGIGYQARTIRKGRRWSAAKAFLEPARGRPNLEVRTGVQVQRLVFEGNRVVGVEMRDASGTSVVRARREVILSAGAIHSPKLLQLSGIGPAALLQRLGIAVVVDAPDVGQNLLEHRCILMQVRLREGSLNQEFGGWRLGKNLVRYALNQSGPLTTAAHEICALVKTRPELARPDGELGIGLYSIKVDAKGKIVIDDQPGMTWVGYFTTPDSRGSVQITSRDPQASPDIDANYFDTERDRRHSADLVRYMRRMLAQPALAPFVVAETQPGPACQSDEQIIEAYLRQGSTTYHVAGTCRMGADERSVVDTRLRVRGVQGLRVMDTSIMPTLISGNTNGPAMAMAMRAAEFIRADALSAQQH